MNGAIWVLAGAASFVGTHFAMSHPLRRPLVARLGEGGFTGLYSLVSFLTMGLMIWAYVAAPVTEPAWPVGDGLWVVATVLMLAASVLLMGSLTRNPALPGAAKQAATAQARGVYGITRHPMLWSFAIWGGSHILVLPIAKNIILSGAIVLLSLVGAAFQDRKKAQLDPQGVVRLAEPHQLSAVRSHRAGPREVRQLRAPRDPGRHRRLAGGDVGAHTARGMARRHLALGGVGLSSNAILFERTASSINSSYRPPCPESGRTAPHPKLKLTDG